MRQSNFIFGALAVAFLFFVTTRGSLPVYMSVLFGTAAAPAAPGTSTGGSSGASTSMSGPLDILSKGVQGAAQSDAAGIIGAIRGFFN